MKRKLKYRKPETVKTGNAVVKIYRRDKRHKPKGGKAVTYTNWVVEDKSNGARNFKSFSDHSEALEHAKRLADRGSSARAVAANMSNEQAASYGRAIQLLPPGISLELACATIAKCVEILGKNGVLADPTVIIQTAQYWKEQGVDKLTPKLLPEVVTELITAKEARKNSDRYVKDLRNRLERFSEDFSVDIHTVGTPDVQRWLDALEVAPQTAKNFRTVLGTLFGFAESRGYIAKGSNPVNDVESIRANGGAILIYTPDEISKLLKAAQKDFVPFIALGAFAGLRSAEIERLEWKDIDSAGGFIHVAADKAKTRSRRLVPIQPNLGAWLKDYASNTGKVWKGDSNDLQDARAATVTASGIAWKDNGARHSYISYRLAGVQDVNKVALEAGNSPAVIFKHYRELVKPEQAKVWFSIMPEQKEGA